jgi:hypothetical protein
MRTTKPPLTTAEHIAIAKQELASGARVDTPIAHALIAIAELLSPPLPTPAESADKPAPGSAAQIGLDIVNRAIKGVR